MSTFTISASHSSTVAGFVTLVEANNITNDTITKTISISKTISNMNDLP